jgi:hypothetical protein
MEIKKFKRCKIYSYIDRNEIVLQGIVIFMIIY